ncbi:MAG: hypothetical protein LUH05_08225 [Candidatus Gastranaerophilales bacterium]|nr:hypothetical protein [Candidatus Gastranaerophilales bacterium]
MYRANAIPFLQEDVFGNKWAVDLENEPLGDFGGFVFSALQFILWTNPDKIYIAGCDCNSGYAYDNKSLLSDHSGKVNGFRKFKDFASRMYPETEIISVNPIGLKGMFKDLYTNTQGDGYEEKCHY